MGERLSKAAPKILYHYCSAETFFQIISTRTVRLSALSLSNDSMEGRLSQQVFIEVCRDIIGEKTVGFMDRVSSGFTDIYGGLGWCLSTKKDKLSQWRGYADDGHGFCIGFETEKLRRVFENVQLGEQRCQLVKVEYREDNQRQMMSELARQMKASWNFSKEGNWSEAEISNAISKRVNIKLVPHLYSLKGSAFDEEDEWRWLLTYNIVSNRVGLMHHASRNKISPYLPVNWKLDANPLVEVIIGPKHITPLPMIEGLVGTLGSKIRVRKSNATYQ